MVRPLEKRKASFRKEFQNHLMSELEQAMERKPSFVLSEAHHDRIKREIENAVGEITGRDTDLSQAPVAKRFVDRKVQETHYYITRVVDEAQLSETQKAKQQPMDQIEIHGMLKGEDPEALSRQVDVEIEALEEQIEEAKQGRHFKKKHTSSDKDYGE